MENLTFWWYMNQPKNRRNSKMGKSENPITIRVISRLHKGGLHEKFCLDSHNRKQGLYVIYSRRTKMKIYECYYVNDMKVGIENSYDLSGKVNSTFNIWYWI